MLQKPNTSAKISTSSRRQRDGGYLLLAILLLMALMIIAATITAPAVVQQIKRDREEEMIHRGVEYARAIRKYYRKFNAYPTSLEQLESTNQMRFLRKRYKDPLTKDGKWTLLHYGDIQTLLNPNTPGTPAAALGQQGQPGALTPGGGPNPFGGAFGAQQNVNPAGGFSSSQANQPGTANSIFSNTGSASQSTDNSGASAISGPGSPSQSTDNSGASAISGPQGSSPFSSGPGAGSPNQLSGTAFGQNSAGGSQTFGAGAIVGVASVSKDPTIRIYNKKKKYNEWQFIYNPQMEQAGVLIKGPYQPTTIGGGQVGTPAAQLAGQQQNGQQQNGFGQSNFGQSGFGQQPQSGFGSQNSSQQYQPYQQPGNNFPPEQQQPQQ